MWLHINKYLLSIYKIKELLSKNVIIMIKLVDLFFIRGNINEI